MSDNELPTKLEAHRKATVAMQKREREQVKKMLKTLDGNVDAAIKLGKFSYTEWYMDGVSRCTDGYDAKLFWKHRDIFKRHFQRLGFKVEFKDELDVDESEFDHFDHEEYVLMWKVLQNQGKLHEHSVKRETRKVKKALAEKGIINYG